MPPKAHTFRLVAEVVPGDVLRALQRICEHPLNRDCKPDFEFDWIKRRIALAGDSPSGVAELKAQFLAAMRKAGAPDDAFLAGVVVEEDGRYIQPIGAALHDTATFGELIGKSLVEAGLRGVKVFDAVTHCDVIVRQSAMSQSFAYADFIAEFPLPPYIKVYDQGIGPMPELLVGQKVGGGGGGAPKKKRKRRK